MRFDEILPILLRGYAFFRKGWNATKMNKEVYVFFDAQPNTIYERGIFVYVDEEYNYIPGWMPSISDLLADDWEEIEFDEDL